MKKEVLGKSTEGRDIELVTYMPEKPAAKERFVLIGGVHGDEPEGVFLVEEFIKQNLGEKLECELYIVPIANPDGYHAKTRANARGIDVNRNFPAKAWNPEARSERYRPGTEPLSEPEARILHDLIDKVRPRLVINCHCYSPMVNINGNCSPAAEVLSECLGYRITDDMGYTTPGSFGEWTVEAYKIPTITLEIEEGIGEKVRQNFPEYVLKAFKSCIP